MALDPLELRAARLAALMPQNNGGLVTYNPVRQVQQQKAAEAAATAAPATPYEQQLALAKQAQQPKGGGGKGILGTLLNNPIGRGVTEALGVLDIPRRVVISGLHELSDLGGDLAKGTNRASWHDFVSQVGDKSYGVGKFVHTGNKWADRALGFTGDLALDPLTYVTFGAGHFAGSSGRIAAATRLAEAAKAAEVAGETAKAAELMNSAAKVGRLGVLGANQAERAIIFDGVKNAEQLSQSGLRFAGARIAGTGDIAEKVGAGLAKTRAAIADHVPSLVRDIRAPQGLEAAYATLRSGEGHTADALGMIARGSTAAAKGGRFAATFANEADKLAHDLHKAGDAVDRAAFDALDRGLPLDSALHADQGKAFFDKVGAAAQESLPHLNLRQDYAPHIWTQEARNALKGEEFAPLRKQIGMDATEATGGAVERTIHPGTKLTLPDGKVVEFTADTAHGAVSAAQINEKLGAALGVKKVIEDRLSRTLQPYVNGIADTVGRAEWLKRLGQIADTGKMLDVVDKQATKAAAKARAADIGKTAAQVGAQADKIAADLATKGGKVKDAALAELQRQLDEATAQLAKAKSVEQLAPKAAPALEAQRRAVTAQAESAVSAAQSKLDQIANEQAALFKSEVQQKADIQAAKADAKATRDAAVKRLKREQATIESGRTPMLDKNGNALRGAAADAKRQASLNDVAQRLAQHQGSIPETQAAREATAALESHVAKVQAQLDARRDAALGSMSQAERAAAKSYDQIDAARKAAGAAWMGAKDVKASFANDVAVARKQLANLKRLSVTPTKGAAEAFGKVEKDLTTVLNDIGHFKGADEVRALMGEYAKGIVELKGARDMQVGLRQMQREVASGKIEPVLRKMIQDGYEQIGAGLLDAADAPLVRSELARQLTNMDVAMRQPKFFKMIGKYTQFFKTYATASFGFHVRNGMTAAFNNAVDGVTVRNMERGIQLWERFARDPQGFFDNLPEWVSKDQANAALDAVFASGGGSGQFGKAEVRLGHNKITNNRFTRLSQRIGGRVEGYARMGMALDTVLAGGSWEEAAARITRVHFDYSQVSKFDATMKQVVPFWTFLSRNVPLQVTQMFLKPRMYQAYASLARNMGQDYSQGMIPKAWQEQGAFQLTDGVWLAPDLAHLRLKSDIAKLTTDPQRLLADVNPLLKVPFETLIAKRKLYSDTPFKQNGFEALSGSGLEALAPVLSALGLTDKAGDGATVISDKLGYGLRGLLPPAAMIQRLGGGTPYYSDKQAQSIAGWGGLPIRLLTPGQQKAEADRRAKAAKAKSPNDAKLAALARWKNGG